MFMKTVFHFVIAASFSSCLMLNRKEAKLAKLNTSSTGKTRNYDAIYAHVASALSRTDFAGPEHMAIGNQAWKAMHDARVWQLWADQSASAASDIMSDLLDQWFPQFMHEDGLRNISVAFMHEDERVKVRPSFSFGAWIALSGDFYVSELNGYPEKDRDALFDRLMNPGSDDFLQVDPASVVDEILAKKDWGGFYKKMYGDIDQLVEYLEQQGIQGAREGQIDGSVARNFWQFWYDWNRYKELAETNFNHFGDIAEREYRQIHALALNTAMKAQKKVHDALNLSRDERTRGTALTEAMQTLQLAFRIEGLSLHYLTDRFAGGHVRVPRTQLQGVCDQTFYKWFKNKIPIPAPLGGFLTKLMHDHDGNNGLYVSYHDGAEQWTAFGDGEFFPDANQPNRDRIVHVVKSSLLEVLAAFAGVMEDTVKKTARQSGLLQSEMHVKFPYEVPDQALKPMFFYDDSIKIRYPRGNTGKTYGVLKSHLRDSSVVLIMPTIHECERAMDQNSTLGNLRCTGCAEIQKYFDPDILDERIAFVEPRR